MMFGTDERGDTQKILDRRLQRLSSLETWFYIRTDTVPRV